MKKLVALGYVLASAFAAQANEWYVEPVIGNDAYDGTSSNVVSDTKGPFRTLQGAMTNAQLKAYDTVWLLPGDYNEGEMEYKGTNRCYISKPGLKLKSTGGKDVTFITGRKQASSSSTTWGTRCIAINSTTTNVVIEGITLRTGAAPYNGSGDTTKGGGVYVNGNTSCWLVDCVVTNCAAAWGAGVYYANAFRTKFYDCWSGGRSAICYSKYLESCIIDWTRSQPAMCYSAAVYNCTIVNCDNAAYYNSIQGFYNTISVNNGSKGKSNGGGKSSIISEVRNCVLGSGVFTNKLGSVVETATCVTGKTLSDTRFANADGKDFRLLTDSPAIGVGDASFLASVPLPEGYEHQDYLGNPLPTSGRINAGAIQYVLPRLIIESSTGGISAEGATVGTNTVSAAISVTVTATDADRRNFLGFEVNGELQPKTGDTLTFEPSLDSGAMTVVRAVYSPDWYVDCEHGDDGNTGYSMDAARKTIRSLTTNECVIAGDVIHVAPGVYGEKEGKNDRKEGTTEAIFTRVVIPADVTVESTEGPERTFIVGAASPTPEYEPYGLGPGAVRCVYGRAGSTLRGFTLTGGHTSSNQVVDASWDIIGSAIVGTSGYITVEDCIISNNVGRQYTCYQAKLNRCRVTDNYTVANASGGFYCGWKNCVIARNHGNHTMFNNKGPVENCFMGPGNYSTISGDGRAQVVSCNVASYPIILVNSVLEYGVFGLMKGTPVATNCVIQSGAVGGSNSVNPTNCFNCVTNKSSSAILAWVDSAYRPLADTPLVDAGANDLISADAAELDLARNPRILNGSVDIGAYEYDWRPTYGEMLGRRVTVTEASPEVVKTGDTLTIPSGGLSGTIGKDGPCTIDFAITGNGTLKVYLNGVLKGEYQQGATTAALGDVTAGTTFNLAYEPGEGDAGGAAISKLAVRTGLLLLVR